MHPGAAAHRLDNPAWSSLTGPHAALAEGRGTARRYRSGVSPFAAIASEHDGEAWAELRTLVTPGETVILFGSQLLAPAPPAGWDLVLVARDATGSRDWSKLLGDLRGALRQAGVPASLPHAEPAP